VTVVRPAQPEDLDQLLGLTEEMDRFYGATEFDPVALRRQQLHDAIFSDQPAAHALLAFDGDMAVGFATYSFLWPAAGLTRSLYLKELFVAGQQQRKGIGRELMQALFDLAAKHGCSRVEWTTDRDNADAQAFYASFGTAPVDAKLFYRLNL
jgi:GNAT superfamily N-acetyltransferase